MKRRRVGGYGGILELKRPCRAGYGSCMFQNNKGEGLGEIPSAIATSTSYFKYLTSKYGGEGGIRTHGTREGSTVFETAPFDHSGTSPRFWGGEAGI